MADWLRSIDFVLNHEGGYVPPKTADPGGETNFGISKRWHPNLDIRGLTIDDAIAIYNREYWAPCHCESMGDDMALCVFDSAVNCGNNKALKWKADSKDDTAEYLNIRERYYKKLCKSKDLFDIFLKGWFKRVDDLREDIALHQRGVA